MVASECKKTNSVCLMHSQSSCSLLLVTTNIQSLLIFLHDVQKGGGTVNLDQMVVNVDEDGNVNPREITRESEHWRAAVYARLGTTARKTNKIQAFQLQEFCDLKNKIWRVEQVLRTLQYAPACCHGDGTTNPTTRAGTVIWTGAPVV